MTDHSRSKFCPSCGDEFQHWVSECPDCGVALGHAPPAAPDAPATLPPPHELLPIHGGDPWELRRLAHALAEGGVPCRVDAYPPQGPVENPEPHERSGHQAFASDLAIYVRPEDKDQAAALREVYLTSRMPGGAVSGQEGADCEACPACGHALPGGAAACPDCGLEFLEIEHDDGGTA